MSSCIWGVQITSASPATIDTEEFDTPLVINRAVLVSGNEAVLSIEIENQNFVLGTLIKGKKEHFNLELRCWESDDDQKYVFRVTGDSKVDLTGYFHPSDPGFGLDDGSEEELTAEMIAEYEAEVNEKIGKKNPPTPIKKSDSKAANQQPAQVPQQQGKKGKKAAPKSDEAPKEVSKPAEAPKESPKTAEAPKESPKTAEAPPGTPKLGESKSAKRKAKKKAAAAANPTPASTTAPTPAPTPATTTTATPAVTPATSTASVPTLVVPESNENPSTPAKSNQNPSPAPSGQKNAGRGGPSPRGGKKGKKGGQKK